MSKVLPRLAAIVFNHILTPPTATTSVSSLDADWSGYIWTGWKQIRFEDFSVDLQYSQLQQSFIKYY